MSDLSFLLLGLAFFVACAGLIAAFGRL